MIAFFIIGSIVLIGLGFWLFRKRRGGGSGGVGSLLDEIDIDLD